MRIGRLILLVAVAAAGLFLLDLFWKWEVERIEVPPGKFLVVIHRWGKDLPPEEIVAPDDSYKGVVKDVRGPGRHFLNPLLWGHEVHDMVNIPAGKCGILTRKYGRPVPPERLDAGELLAREEERGIVEDPLMPGTYSINPYAYDLKTVDAVEIKAEFVGVRTRKVGKDPGTLPAGKRPSSYVVAEDGFRGVQQHFLPPGTYYINPFVESITPIEVRSHKVDFDDISFPSRDGFQLKPHIQVEYAVMKDKASELMVRVTDEGVIFQGDRTKEDIAKNEILQKVILPHVRGFARIEGSNFNATDFILVPGEAAAQEAAGNNREKFRKALMEAVQPRCAKLGIDIRAISVGQMEPPPELAKEISDRETALAEQQRNLELVKQYKNEQALKAQEAQAEQKREKVQAETRLAQAETEAQQKLEVEKQKLEAALTVAQSQLEAAREKAKAVEAKAKADADVISAQNEAEVAALKKSVEGFGSPELYAQWMILSRVAPALGEIFASDQSDFARLFADMLTPQAGSSGGPMPKPPGTKPPVAGTSANRGAAGSLRAAPLPAQPPRTPPARRPMELLPPPALAP